MRYAARQAKLRPVLCLALASAWACSTPHGKSGSSSALAPTPHQPSAGIATPQRSAAAPSAGSSAAALGATPPGAAGQGTERAAFTLTLTDQGAASERRALQRRLAALSGPAMQRRQATARSFTQLGGDVSAPLEIQATLAVRGAPSGAAGRAQVLIAVTAPHAETPLEVLTELLPHGFVDKPAAEPRGFARSLLPSVLLDVVPTVPLGIGASWTLSFDRQEDGRRVHSVREYRVTRFVPAAGKPWAGDGPLAELAFSWKDSAAGEPASVTTGALWHSPRWLYPLAHLRNQAQAGEIRLITELRVEHPSFGELPELPKQ